MRSEGRGRRPRDLTPGERALWRSVTADIVARRAAPAGPTTEGATAMPEPVTPDQPAPAQAQAARAPTPPPLATLDRRLRQRLARGQVDADGSLDLHGLDQARAFTTLFAFLQTAQRRGARVVIVVTGKGGRSGAPGVLRRAVPLWLAAATARPLVVGFEEAAPAHGGAGALYVRLRRVRG